jgi:hypothetical protein
VSGTVERGLSDEGDRRLRLRRQSDASLRDAVEKLHTRIRVAESVALRNRALLEDLGVDAMSLRQRNAFPALVEVFEAQQQERSDADATRRTQERRFNRRLGVVAALVGVVTVVAPYIHDLVISHHI